MLENVDLSAKLKIFCNEYLIDENATRAAIQAGYSEKTAYSQGSRLLKNVKVITYLAEKRKKQIDKLEITVERILEETAKIAFIKESEFYNDDGSVKKLSELTDNQKSALSSYGFKSIPIGDGMYEDVPVFKAQDKMKALDMLFKYKGLYEKDNEQGKSTSPQFNLTVAPKKK